MLLSLNRSYNISVEGTYIIRLKGHSFSEEQAKECAESCERVGQKYQFWEAFDGTSGSLSVPPSLRGQSWISWLKNVDHHLSITEIACVLSHMSLWVRCMEIDQPIVILEHDAQMVKKFDMHSVYNAIIYLGSIEQRQGQFPILPIPPHGSINKNYHMICRAHAYSIDPPMAANLFSHILKMGIHESLDVMIRPELFTIVQTDFIAYDNFKGTTITNRKKDLLGHER